MQILFDQLATYLNNFLRQSPTAIDRIKKLEGTSYKLHLKGIELSIVLKINDEIFILSKESTEGTSDDVYLEAYPSDIVFVLLKGVENLTSEDIHFKGNVGLLNDLSFIMKALYPDLYGILEPVVGRVIATEMTNIAQYIMMTESDLRTTFRRSIEEYLKEETEVLPTDFELQLFYKDVVTLRDDVERAQKKLNQKYQ
jgi:ubiquinone biosynthesis accessory factor UbiJ